MFRAQGHTNLSVYLSIGAWRSLVARCNGVAEVAGSNPVAPTNLKSQILNVSGFFAVFNSKWQHHGSLHAV